MDFLLPILDGNEARLREGVVSYPSFAVEVERIVSTLEKDGSSIAREARRLWGRRLKGWAYAEGVSTVGWYW